MPPALPSPRTLLTVAWLAILLGIAVETALLVVSMSMGKDAAVPAILAETANKVSWSFFVCVGVALGMGSLRVRPAAMGILGLISAPIAFAIAKALHKSVAQALGAAGAPPSVPGPVEMAVLRAVEYGLLGGLLGWISRQVWSGFKVHAGLGLLIGLFAAAFVTMRSVSAGASGVALVIKGLNEVLFPLGCAIVLYAAAAFGRRATSPP